MKNHEPIHPEKNKGEDYYGEGKPMERYRDEDDQENAYRMFNSELFCAEDTILR